jgi:hypothetical protein
MEIRIIIFDSLSLKVKVWRQPGLIVVVFAVYISDLY